MKKLTKFFLAVVLCWQVCLFCTECGAKRFEFTMSVTDISQQVYDLHMLMFWICVGIAVIVFGVMFVSLFVTAKSEALNQLTSMRVSK